jgi:hypothetical protein
MSKKLTLNIDDDLISFAHSYSQQTGQSISKLFEQYLARLRTTEQKQELNPKTINLYGLFQDSPIPDKKQLRKNFHEKNSN